MKKLKKFMGVKEEFVTKIPEYLQDKICLMGLQGSRGLGMAQSEDADYDYRGVFVADNDELLGLKKLKETYEFGEYGDGEAEFVFHEVGKFVRLCMKGNPSVLQILFIKKHNSKDNVGKMLVDNRANLVGTTAVKKSFGGYALAQAKRLNKTGSFSHGRKRSKHIRHIFRLFDQGQELLETGHIALPLKDPQKYIDMGKIESNEEVLRLFEKRDKEFHASKSILQEKPDEYLVNKILLQIRNGL